MTTRTIAPRPAHLLGALATAALMIGPALAVAKAATPHPAPRPPAPARGGCHATPVALRPRRLRLRADRLEAGYALSLR